MLGTYLSRAEPVAPNLQEPLPAAPGPEWLPAGSVAAVMNSVPGMCQTGFGKWHCLSILYVLLGFCLVDMLDIVGFHVSHVGIWLIRVTIGFCHGSR
jgi:hypothetical protein